MAATKRNAMNIPKARDAIRATQLMNRLSDHGHGKIELSQTQVRAIDIVLKKLVPDLQSVALKNDESSGPLQITWSAK